MQSLRWQTQEWVSRRRSLPRLFERFHRVKGAKSRTHEGTGIGLALVQELIALHGGGGAHRERGR